MKKITSILLALIVAAAMMSAPVFAVDAGTQDGASTAALGTNGNAAKAYFGATEQIVLETATADTIQESLYFARDMTAQTKKPVIVNVKSGTISLPGALSVPYNVVLASESGVVYNMTGSDRMVLLNGSVYGGKFDGKGKAKNIIQMYRTNTAASDKNLTVMKTTLTNSETYPKIAAVQIDANGAKIVNGKVIDNTIFKCYNGISVYDGGSYSVISGNKIYSIGNKSRKGGSAIDICSSNVTKISGNSISDVFGHGISTDPTSDSGKYRYGCKIGEISGNTIKKINTQGIYIENKCSVTRIKNNTISNVKGCCLTVDKNAKVYAFAGNKLAGGTLAKKGKHSLVTIGGKKSYVKMGKNNKISGGSAAGIYVGKSARLEIVGKGNVITGNKLNGIQMAKGSVLKITGKTSITKNRWGINMDKGAKATIKYVTFKGNKKGAVYYLKGAKFKKSKCKVKGKIYKAG